MQTQNNEKTSFIRFFIAGLLCFAAAYFSEKQLGVIATFPFLLVLPGIACLLYKKPLHLAGFSLIAGFMFKCIYASNAREIVMFSLFCAVLTLVSAYTFKCIYEKVTQDKKNRMTVVFPVLFAVSLVIYIICFGTVFGYLPSKEANIKYLEATYPSEDFNIGSTYYSVRDGEYITEFTFTAKERYRASVSAKKDGNAVIDGYRDLIRHELLTEGLNRIRLGLSTFAYENSDYAIRYDDINSDDIITSERSYSEYADMCRYEIALYYQFATEEEFEEMCRSYIEHLSSYENVRYQRIRFYGFDLSDKVEFAYMTDYSFADGTFSTGSFDDKDYSRYFTEEDTHKHWDLLV